MAAISLKEKLKEADLKADMLLEDMKHPAISLDQFTECVKEYLMCKFFLEPEEYLTENILDLAEISIEKLLRINDKSVKLAQASTTCTNQSSTDVKKVLLSLTLQRGLGVKMTPDESAELETVTQFASALYKKSHAKQGLVDQIDMIK